MDTNTPKNYAKFLLWNCGGIDEAIEHTTYEDVIKAHGEPFLEETRKEIEKKRKPIGDVKAVAPTTTTTKKRK